MHCSTTSSRDTVDGAQRLREAGPLYIHPICRMDCLQRESRLPGCKELRPLHQACSTTCPIPQWKLRVQLYVISSPRLVEHLCQGWRLLLFRSHSASATVLVLLTDIRSNMSSRSPNAMRTGTCFRGFDAGGLGTAPVGTTAPERKTGKRLVCACTCTCVAARNVRCLGHCRIQVTLNINININILLMHCVTH